MKAKFVAVVVFAVLFVFGFYAAVRQNQRPEPVRHAEIALGTLVEIQVRGKDGERARNAVRRAAEEIRRVDRLFSRHDPQSPLWQINHGPLARRDVPPEIFRMMQRCDSLWQETGGAFDASLGVLAQAWGFYGERPAVPDGKALQEARGRSGWRHVRLGQAGTMERAAPVEFDFGALAKGYAVDRAVEVLSREGAGEALVDAGGEIRATGGAWVIGIRHPRREKEILRRLDLQGRAVATSGDYERFFEQGGKRYCHILDPRTGHPAMEVQSVTVVASQCEEADALATALFVAGPAAGKDMLGRFPGAMALFVDAQGTMLPLGGIERYFIR